MIEPAHGTRLFRLLPSVEVTAPTPAPTLGFTSVLNRAREYFPAPFFKVSHIFRTDVLSPKQTLPFLVPSPPFFSRDNFRFFNPFSRAPPRNSSPAVETLRFFLFAYSPEFPVESSSTFFARIPFWRMLLPNPPSQSTLSPSPRSALEILRFALYDLIMRIRSLLWQGDQATLALPSFTF